MSVGMDILEIPSFPNSCFSDIFSKANGLNKYGFTTWVLHAGMEFRAENTWWGEKKKRARPHEGIDLRFYRSINERVFAIDSGAKIPVMYDGVTVKIVNDFLGKTIIIEHRFPDTDEGIYLTFYGHTKPTEGLGIGQVVKEGDIIATLAPSKGGKSPPPHLHLSLAWSRKPVPYDTLDWITINNPDVVRLIDPQTVIGVSESIE